MAQDLAKLIAQENWHPTALVGHSAGGALALRTSTLIDPHPLVIGINPALDTFHGVAGVLFPVMAKLLAVTPGVSSLFAKSGSRVSRVRALIESTGTTLPDEGINLYQRLVSDRTHVDATLLMMAQWSLDDLHADLPQTHSPTLFLTGDQDLAVPPMVADDAASVMRDARVVHLAGLGHVAHEEDPQRLADEIETFVHSCIAHPA